MENKSPMKIKLLSPLLLLILIFAGISFAEENRKVNKMIVDDYFENQIALKLLAPQNYWLLIVLDGNLSSSHDYLKQMLDQKTDMSATIIVLLNSEDSKETFYNKYHASLQPYSWVNAKGSDVFKQMNISATPVAFGMHKDSVKWQNSGLPNNFAEALLITKQIKNWINHKVQE